MIGGGIFWGGGFVSTSWRQLVISEDSTPKDDEITDGVDEGFVDESTTLSSISEHLLTVGEGGTEEEAEEKNEDPEDEVCPILT